MRNLDTGLYFGGAERKHKSINDSKNGDQINHWSEKTTIMEAEI